MKLIYKTFAGVAVSAFAITSASAATLTVEAPSFDNVPAVELTTETVVLVAGANKMDCSQAKDRANCIKRRAIKRNVQANQKTKAAAQNMKERLAKQRANGNAEALKERRENIYQKRAERKAKTRTHYHTQIEKHNP